MSEISIRPLERSDREWVAHFLDETWGTTVIVSRGKTLYGHLLPGFMAERALETAGDDAPTDDPPKRNLGLVTLSIVGDECEFATLNSLTESEGIGSALVTAVEHWALEAGIKRLWLVTTNDNLAALKFWQKRDYELVAVHRNAIAAARRIKPQIPITGIDGIIIRDEIELEKLL